MNATLAFFQWQNAVVTCPHSTSMGWTWAQLVRQTSKTQQEEKAIYFTYERRFLFPFQQKQNQKLLVSALRSKEAWIQSMTRVNKSFTSICPLLEVCLHTFMRITLQKLKKILWTRNYTCLLILYIVLSNNANSKDYLTCHYQYYWMINVWSLFTDVKNNE